MPNPLIIGLTGGIASGKSTVALLLAEQGATVIDTDQVARDITRSGNAISSQIVLYFGRDVVGEDGELDRAQLRIIIFSEPQKRQWLEQLLHPEIHRQVLKQIDAATTDVIVVMIPLLKSRERYPLDVIWTIETSHNEQVRRACQRDGVTVAQAEAMIAAQPSPAQRQALADVVIRNEGDLSALTDKVKKALSALSI